MAVRDGHEPGNDRVGDSRSTAQLGQGRGRDSSSSEARLIGAVERIWLDGGDLALSVRRVLNEARVAKRDLYLLFGSREALIEHTAMALADQAQQWSAVSTRADCLAVALERPAAWKAVMLGYGPDGHTGGSDHFSTIRAKIGSSVGGDVELAKIAGVVEALAAGHLNMSTANDWVKTAGD